MARIMFITIDGPDGAGKTTIAQKLVGLINEKPDHKAIYTCEPTNGAAGRIVRDILKKADPDEMLLLTELFVKDRAEHVEEIAERLKEGYTVVCDRYIYSTVVYQNLQGEETEKLIEMNGDFIKPDYAFILNAGNTDTLLAHIEKRGTETEIFETRKSLEKVVKLYNDLRQYYDVVYINAEQDSDKMLEDISAHLKL